MKSEKQMEAQRLYSKFIPFEFKTFEYNGIYYRIINSVRYIRSGDLAITDAIRQFLIKGLITHDDVIPGKQVGEGRRFVGRPCTLLKLSTLKKLKKEFLETKRYSNIEEFDDYIKKAEEVDNPPQSNFTQKKITEIWKIYDERQRLITENSRERKEEQRREYEEADFNEPPQPKDDLNGLVDRIEAMGWHVTLTRKEGV